MLLPINDIRDLTQSGPPAIFPPLAIDEATTRSKEDNDIVSYLSKMKFKGQPSHEPVQKRKDQIRRHNLSLPLLLLASKSFLVTTRCVTEALTLGECLPPLSSI
jgi:hypothetical protein